LIPKINVSKTPVIAVSLLRIFSLLDFVDIISGAKTFFAAKSRPTDIQQRALFETQSIEIRHRPWEWPIG